MNLRNLGLLGATTALVLCVGLYFVSISSGPKVNRPRPPALFEGAEPIGTAVAISLTDLNQFVIAALNAESKLNNVRLTSVYQTVDMRRTEITYLKANQGMQPMVRREQTLERISASGSQRPTVRRTVTLTYLKREGDEWIIGNHLAIKRFIGQNDEALAALTKVDPTAQMNDRANCTKQEFSSGPRTFTYLRATFTDSAKSAMVRKFEELAADQSLSEYGLATANLAKLKASLPDVHEIIIDGKTGIIVWDLLVDHNQKILLEKRVDSIRSATSMNDDIFSIPADYEKRIPMTQEEYMQLQRKAAVIRVRHDSPKAAIQGK